MYYTVGFLLEKHIINTDGTFLEFKIDREHCVTVINDVLTRVNGFAFQQDPNVYLSSWQAERGESKEVRIPEDYSMAIIELYLTQFTQFTEILKGE